MMIKEIGVKELHEWLQSDQPPYLIDVRTPEEMATAAIANATPIPLQILPMRIQDVPKDKDVVFYCRSGNRSGQACVLLQQQEYDNVYNMRGGMIEWSAQGLPSEPLIMK